MSSRYFHDKLSIDEKYMPQVIRWLENWYGFKLIKDLRDDPESRQDDVDLLMNDSVLGSFKVEVKIREKFYEDIAVETKSNVEWNTQGYIFKSKALLLAYVYLDGDKLHPIKHLIHMSLLRGWFVRNHKRYRKVLAPNPPENPVYHTEFSPVPTNDIPRHFFLS